VSSPRTLSGALKIIKELESKLKNMDEAYQAMSREMAKLDPLVDAITKIVNTRMQDKLAELREWAVELVEETVRAHEEHYDHNPW
jgi:hypothetical protein